MKRVLSSFLIYALFPQTTFAAGVPQKLPTDTVQMGKSGSSDDRKFIFDVGDGVTNPQIKVNPVSKEFDLSKTLNVTGNQTTSGNTVTTGTVTGKNGLVIGAGVAADKSITMDRGGSNPFMKWDNTLQSWVFSNDGSIAKKLGSGSGSGGGGGTNGLLNDSFEDFTAGAFPNWTNSGGTVTQGTFASGLENDTKYIQFVATTSGQYIEQTFVVPTTLGDGCQIDFKKVNTTVANIFKIEALDASNNVLATANIPVLTWQKIPTLSFKCPAVGTVLKARVTSLAAGTFQGDKAYNGSNQNLVYTSQAKLLGTVTVTGCASSWATTSASFVDYPTQTGCSYATTGNALAPSTNIPAIRFASLPAGDYRLEYEGELFNNVVNTVSGYQFWDGTNVAREITNMHAGNGGGIGATAISQTISYATTQNNVTLSIRGRASGGNNNIYGINGEPGTIKVWYFPSKDEVAISNEQASWFIDANIGGGNPTVSGPTASYTEATDAGLDLVINNGSAPVEIACSGTNPSTGLTCAAGSESVGIAFTPPMTGRYKVCAYYASNYGSGSAALQLIETPNNAQTILQEGNTRLPVTQAAASGGDYAPQSNCGYFSFNSTSKRTIRLMAEVNSGSLGMLADRSATIGQRDIHFTVDNVTFGQNRPILNGNTVTTSGIGSGSTGQFSFSYGNAATTECTTTNTNCAYLDQIGDDVLNVFHGAGVGQMTANFKYTYSKLKCHVRGFNAVTNALDSASSMVCSNCSSLNFNTVLGANDAGSDGWGTVFCDWLK